jgi:NitT/TauT family transport system substrate-binding protein
VQRSRLAGLKGTTVVLGSAGWQAICDPMFASNGIDPSSITMSRPQTAGARCWRGKADAALSWEGLRARWKGQGLEFDYLIGRNFSKLPANTFVMGRAEFEDASKKGPLHQVPPRLGDGSGARVSQACRNAGHDAAVPRLASQMSRPLVVLSMMQLAKVFRCKFEKRKGWGSHDEEAWGFFFKTIKDIGQVQADVKVADDIKNDQVASASEFDMAEAKAGVEGYKLADDYASIDAEAIRKAP